MYDIPYHNHQWQLVRSRAWLLLKPSKPPQMGSTSWNTEDTNPPKRVTPRDVKSLDFGCGQWCDLDLITPPDLEDTGSLVYLRFERNMEGNGWNWSFDCNLFIKFWRKAGWTKFEELHRNRDEIGMWMATLCYFGLVDGMRTVLHRMIPALPAFHGFMGLRSLDVMDLMKRERVRSLSKDIQRLKIAFASFGFPVQASKNGLVMSGSDDSVCPLSKTRGVLACEAMLTSYVVCLKRLLSFRFTVFYPPQKDAAGCQMFMGRKTSKINMLQLGRKAYTNNIK